MRASECGPYERLVGYVLPLEYVKVSRVVLFLLPHHGTYAVVASIVGIRRCYADVQGLSAVPKGTGQYVRRPELCLWDEVASLKFRVRVAHGRGVVDKLGDPVVSSCNFCLRAA